MKTFLKKFWAMYCTCLFSIACISQNFTVTHLNLSDTTKNYFVVYDVPKEVKGVLILLPSFGEAAYTIKNETEIIKYALSQGLFTASVTLQDGPFSFCIDHKSQRTLSEIIDQIYQEYKLAGKKLYLGGFSIGGSGVIRYYENAISSNQPYIPAAVFAIDPPLDFIRLYNSSKRTLITDPKNQEASFVVERIEYEFKGTPEKNYESFLANSPYIFNDSSSAIKILKNSPLLLISEPDIEWQLERRNRDYYDINTFDCAGVIRMLRNLGNNKASLVITSGKGYRKVRNSRNPHSWSIADPEKTVNWLLQY